MIPVIDIFAGPGGLAEGFSAITDDGGRCFAMRLSIEMESYAFATLKLRSFCRQFPPGHLPDEYYDFVKGKLSLDELGAACPEQLMAASQETWQVELGNCPYEEVDDRIKKALASAQKWILIGGPPCQAYSYAGIVGNRTNRQYTPDKDKHYTLYEEYIRIMAVHKPTVFVLENVPGMLFAKLSGQNIFPTILKWLSKPGDFIEESSNHGYRLFNIDGLLCDPTETNPRKFIVQCEDYGIPQARHRVIIIGIRNDIIENSRFVAQPKESYMTVASVLNGLPILRSSLSKEPDSLSAWRGVFIEAIKNGLHKDIGRSFGKELGQIFHDAATALVAVSPDSSGRDYIQGQFIPEKMADWYIDPRLGGALHHEARPQIREDLIRYLLVACHAKLRGFSPKVYAFPEKLLPIHKNALSGDFRERFKALKLSTPAHTIISHLSKDGHGFIHPDITQCRSLTPREAARLQTFPDNYFFFGGRAAKFRQIGNAVPPLLACKIARSIIHLLR